MTVPASSRDSNSSDIVIDLHDAAAVVAFGQEALDDALGKRIASAIMEAPIAALADALQQIRQALQAQDPTQLRKSVGVFGRLLGEDIELEARARQLQSRLGVLLAVAEDKSQALATHMSTLDTLRQALSSSCAQLDARIAAGRKFLETHPDAGLQSALPTPPRERFQQRLDHLDAVRVSHDITARQLDLVCDQIQTLRVRHGRLRDLLVPTLRQNALAVFQNMAQVDQLLDASTLPELLPGSGSVVSSSVAVGVEPTGADPLPGTPTLSTKEQAP